MLLSSLRLFFVISLAFWPFGGESGSGSSPRLLESSLQLPQNPDSVAFVRVRLAAGEESLLIETANPFDLYDGRGNRLMSSTQLVSSEIKPSETGIRLGIQNFSVDQLDFVSRGEGFKIKDRYFRDTIRILRQPDHKLMVINRLPVDDYLQGVLPWEANPKWTHESLKAQAIASRTYAVFKVIENYELPYDLTSDVYSQVYKGKSIEAESTTYAVQATRGQIMTYRGMIFPAYFHSTCGGGTARAHKLWNIKSNGTLQGTKCGFCSGSKHYRWAVEIEAKHIGEKLLKQKIDVGEIIELIPHNIDAHGRAESFRIRGSKGTETVQANFFRIWIGPSLLKSTLIQSIEATPSGFKIEGRGWGHGAGLCQYGMKSLGELGYNARKILRYYYAESDITQYFPFKQAGQS